MNISEVIRRWQAGGSRRRIASGTGLSRETVGKYIALAEGIGVSREGPAPTEDRLAPWADRICRWLTGDRLQLTRVQELLAQRGCPVSYASPHRFAARQQVASDEQRLHFPRGKAGVSRPTGFHSKRLNVQDAVMPFVVSACLLASAKRMTSDGSPFSPSGHLRRQRRKSEHREPGPASIHHHPRQ